MSPSASGKSEYNRNMKVLLFSVTFLLIPLIADCRIIETADDNSTTVNSGQNSNVSQNENRFTLDSIISYAFKYNPNLRNAATDTRIEQYEIDSARANRMPKIDLGGGVTRFRYDTPLTPLVISPPISATTEFPVMRRTIWDTGVSFRLALFKGGRLYRAVTVAEIKKDIAEEVYKLNKQELIYNLTSVFYKISQLERLLIASEQIVRQLESHKRNVDLFLKTGSVPKLDLLRIEVELAHAIENKIAVRNNLTGMYEVLKSLMGVDDVNTTITLIFEDGPAKQCPTVEESIKKAFLQRPDYAAVIKKKAIGEERIRIAEGKSLPEISAGGEYVGKAGNRTSFKENWNYGVRFTLPLFDGGLIRSEVNKEKAGLEKIKEEERALKLLIHREVKDAYLNIDTALERVQVTQKAIESARENVRIEVLKYNEGAGTNTDVIDAHTALLRAETDYYRAVFDREIAFAFLDKAVGEDTYGSEVQK